MLDILHINSGLLSLPDVLITAFPFSNDVGFFIFSKVNKFTLLLPACARWFFYGPPKWKIR
jgi:hypothetical protein